jgi:hypothetical protein
MAGFTTDGRLRRHRATRLARLEIGVSRRHRSKSGGMPDQSWWNPATDGISLTQGENVRKTNAARKRKFLAETFVLGLSVLSLE